jgi:hypothetical protein
MEKYSMPQLLLIAGTGRNSGKTSLGCAILEKYGRQFPIFSLKITPHFHKGIRTGIVLYDSPDCFIAEEVSPGNEKDSQRYLAFGASRSFFMMTRDDQLGMALEVLFSKVPMEQHWICESGGARQWINPGVFLMLSQAVIEDRKPGIERNLSLAHKILQMNKDGFDFSLDELEPKPGNWYLKGLG